ncbi:MAG TPA: YiiD C-terminal domain-containing protein [bacterium]|jgi:thioesterase domain-containing protein|nr:YiiD C-terminal domain-containing protein [bacterium]
MMKAELQAALFEEIPLTRAMGMAVAEAGPDLVRLELPLEPNHNHKHTAFGGSLYSAAVLAGWGVLWCALKERGLAAQVVISGSGDRFLKAVDGDFSAECVVAPGGLDFAFRALERKGMARVQLDSVVFCRGEACVAFQGSYALVALK